MMLPKPIKFFNRISKNEFYVILQKRVAPQLSFEFKSLLVNQEMLQRQQDKQSDRFEYLRPWLKRDRV